MKKSIFTRKMFYLIILSFLLIESPSVYAQTDVSTGDVSGTWSLTNSPYHINGEITIPDGQTLIIEPGVEVIFTGHYKFIVNGRLMAIGTELENIIFTANNYDTGWHGLRFVDTPVTNDSSKVVYCLLQFGRNNNSGGAIIVVNYDKLLVANCRIKNNSAGSDLQSGGGGILISSCSPKIVNNTISNNNGTGSHGGGIFIVFNSKPIIMNNIIINNQALGGGGIAFYDCNPQLINNTISNNNALDHGGGIDCINSSPTLINTIIYGNTAYLGKQVHFNAPPEPNFKYCDIKGGSSAFARNHSTSNIYNGTYTNNIDSDPLFVAEANYNYRLSNTSPCIGAGYYETGLTPSCDCEGNLRPWPLDSNPDIGAFENQFANSTDIMEYENQLPSKFALSQNYPNPFNPSTVISYTLPPSVKSEKANVKLDVYNILGREVTTLVNEKQNPGYYEAEWNANDKPSGVYFYKLKAGEFVETKKMILLR